MATGTSLQELLKSAEEAVEVIKDEEHKLIAFERVLDHLLKTADGNPAVEARAPIPSISDSSSMTDGVFASEQQRTDAIAEYFGIEPEQVLDIFNVTDEDPSLNIRSNQLPESMAEGTRHIALLITGARTALGRDTDTKLIREVADNYNKLSSSNFMTTLSNMPQLSLLGRRGSLKRLVRMKVRGAEEARELAQRLIEG